MNFRRLVQRGAPLLVAIPLLCLTSGAAASDMELTLQVKAGEQVVSTERTYEQPSEVKPQPVATAGQRYAVTAVLVLVEKDSDGPIERVGVSSRPALRGDIVRAGKVVTVTDPMMSRAILDPIASAVDSQQATGFERVHHVPGFLAFLLRTLRPRLRHGHRFQPGVRVRR